MIKITICIGSSCHLKGSRQVIEKLQELIKDNDVQAEINLGGAFCMNKCQEKGVNVNVDGKHYSITPEMTEKFFEEEILSKLK